MGKNRTSGVQGKSQKLYTMIDALTSKSFHIYILEHLQLHNAL